jgi:4-hydroxybenzoate polyprenyltransferase
MTQGSTISSSLYELAKLSRPKQWLKNVFVAIPLFFTPALLSFDSLFRVLVAVACFCLWSSSVYLFNDALDVESDRQHPRKRFRPVAAGRISVQLALSVSAVLMLGATILASATLPRAFVLMGFLYLANSVIYCILLKHRVIADVIAIAIGFVLRLLGGCAAIEVEPSSWIIVCGFSLALVLGFGKRRAEIERLERGGEFRTTLKSYTSQKLDTMLGIASSICLMSYMLYTVSAETVALQGTDKLIYTVPFVAYGIFRFMFLTQEGVADGPTEILTRDPIFALNGVLWLLAVLSILYFT